METFMVKIDCMFMSYQTSQTKLSGYKQATAKVKIVGQPSFHLTKLLQNPGVKLHPKECCV